MPPLLLEAGVQEQYMTMVLGKSATVLLSLMDHDRETISYGKFEKDPGAL